MLAHREAMKYLACAEEYLPSSWQPPSLAYFRRPEYQLFVVKPASLEYNSLNLNFTKNELKILQVLK